MGKVYLQLERSGDVVGAATTFVNGRPQYIRARVQGDVGTDKDKYNPWREAVVAVYAERDAVQNGAGKRETV